MAISNKPGSGGPWASFRTIGEDYRKRGWETPGGLGTLLLVLAVSSVVGASYGLRLYEKVVYSTRIDPIQGATAPPEGRHLTLMGVFLVGGAAGGALGGLFLWFKGEEVWFTGRDKE